MLSARCHLGLFLLLSLVLTSCLDDPTLDGAEDERIVQENVLDRIEAFRIRFVADCRDKVMAAAALRADSLLQVRARRIRELAGRPPRPVRPGDPPRRSLSAELPLRPLFPYEILFDTLLRDSLYQDSLLLDSIFQDSIYRDSLRLFAPPPRRPKRPGGLPQ